MSAAFEPLHAQSIKQVCIEHLQHMILTGVLQIGERLPAERELAKQLGVSRPVLHEALVELAAQGLVTIQPRHGVHINDFRTAGSISMLTALLDFKHGDLAPAFFQDMVAMRRLIEVENARCAAQQRTPEHLRQFAEIIQREALTNDPAELTELDFSFHLLVAIASGNLIFPLLINSFKPFYTSVTGRFFRQFQGSPAIAEVREFQQRLVATLEAGDPVAAAESMRAMLARGEELLQGTVNS